MLKYLVWVPGLFWLYPVKIRQKIPSDSELSLHAIYSAVQITSPLFAFAIWSIVQIIRPH
jgi:hypothetical protein